MLQARPYQQEAIDGIHTAFREHQSTLLVLATGLGKTICFCDVAGDYMNKGKVMILAHRAELIYQAQEKMIMVTGIEADLEMGEFHHENSFITDARAICSTIQTQCAGMNGEGRMTKFDPMEFSLLIVDECFPAGTLIDGVPIERLRDGEYVNSYNHEKKRIEQKKITHVFKQETDIIVEIRLSGGERLACTPNHPIYTLNRGYVPAIVLNSFDMVIAATRQERSTSEAEKMCRVRSGIHPEKLEQHNDADMLGALQAETQGASSDKGIAEVQHLRGGDDVKREERTCEGQEEKCRVRGRMPTGIEFENNEQNEQEICLCQNENEESYAPARNPREGVGTVAINRMEANSAGRERERPNDSAGATCMCSGVEHGNCYTHEERKGAGIPDMLQGGHRQRGFEDSDRGGRKQPHDFGAAKAGRQKNFLTCAVRVDGIEVHERGSYGRFDELCGEGFVYNLEVADNNNYFAEDILVHNCHHAAAKSYKRVIDYYTQNPNLKVLGVTATPDRTDELALGQIFESVAYEYGILEGIQAAWLVPIMQRAVFVEGLDYSSIRTTAGDLNGADLAKVMEFEEALHGIASPTMEIIEDRKTLVFAASLAQADRLTEIFNRHNEGCARFVHGGTVGEERRQMLRDYANKKFQILVNVGIATEGFDDPGIEVVVMARPTKSRSLYAQMIGRGTRALTGVLDGLSQEAARHAAILASSKPVLEVIDFVGNAGRHRLITTLDILGGKYEDAVVDLATELAQEKSMKEGKCLDTMSELMQAEAELLKRQQESDAAAIRAVVKIRAKYSTAKINPFDIFDVMPERERAWNKERQPSEKQTAMLERNGVDTSGLSFSHASQLIGTIIKRREEDKCSFKQAKLLKRFGYESDKGFKEASGLIDAIAKNGWKRPRTEVEANAID